MSSPPRSQPETPVEEPTIAVDKENTALRSPLPAPPVNGPDKVVLPVEIGKLKHPGEEVQVPGTAPAKADSPIHKPDEAHTGDQAEDEHDNDTEEPTSDSETTGSEAVISDLPVFDWEDLQRRYTAGIKAVNGAEDEILEEFYKYSDAFSVWGGASANRDNERAAKRLKTREQFVRLGEASLQEKKKHYIEVVDAFKKALDLLRR